MPSDEQRVDRDDTVENAALRRAYHAPELSCLGSLTELTRTSSSFSASTDGGGSFPNIYTS